MQQHRQKPVCTDGNIGNQAAIGCSALLSIRTGRFQLLLLALVLLALAFVPGTVGRAVAQDLESSSQESESESAQAESASQNIQSDAGSGLLSQNLPQGLVVRITFDKSSQSSLSFDLNYRDYPALVIAFLYFVQNEVELYREVQFASRQRASYGHTFTSLPPASGINSLPEVVTSGAANSNSDPPPQPGLAFWRNGSVLRSDILVLTSSVAGVRDQNNLVFFGSLLPAESKLPSRFSPRQGLQLLGVEARNQEAQEFLDSWQQILSGDREAYTGSLEQAWQQYIEDNWPQVAELLAQSDDWTRDAFGYYSRYVVEGQGALPQEGEDLNITLERKAFAGQQPQSLPVIIGFGRDVLPMPFSYFVARAPKGSKMEILCPPSAVRSNLGVLPSEYGNTRYQWLLDSYTGGAWVYLSFDLEIY